MSRLFDGNVNNQENAEIFAIRNALHADGFVSFLAALDSYLYDNANSLSAIDCDLFQQIYTEVERLYNAYVNPTADLLRTLSRVSHQEENRILTSIERNWSRVEREAEARTVSQQNRAM